MTSDQKSLEGRTILITRTRTQSTGFRELLEKAGAKVLEVPAIEIRPRMSAELDEAIHQLETYDWLFFTSANAAAIFADQVAHLRPDLRPESLDRPRVCAIGPATSEKIQSFGYRVALIPAVFQAEGVIEEFVKFHGGHLEGLKNSSSPGRPSPRDTAGGIAAKRCFRQPDPRLRHRRSGGDGGKFARTAPGSEDRSRHLHQLFDRSELYPGGRVRHRSFQVQIRGDRPYHGGNGQRIRPSDRYPSQ